MLSNNLFSFHPQRRASSLVITSTWWRHELRKKFTGAWFMDFTVFCLHRFVYMWKWIITHSMSNTFETYSTTIMRWSMRRLSRRWDFVFVFRQPWPWGRATHTYPPLRTHVYRRQNKLRRSEWIRGGIYLLLKAFRWEISWWKRPSGVSCIDTFTGSDWWAERFN